MTNTDISDYWRNEVRLTTDSQPPALPADVAELLRGVTIQPVKVSTETAMIKCDDGQYHGFEVVTVTF